MVILVALYEILRCAQDDKRRFARTSHEKPVSRATLPLPCRLLAINVMEGNRRRDWVRAPSKFDLPVSTNPDATLAGEHDMGNLVADQTTENPFWFRECFLIPMPIGRKAINLRELLQAIREADESVLYYHLLQSRLIQSQPTVEFPNDFAMWAASSLQDSRLAEKLSSFDPFEYETLTDVRQAMIDIMEEYLWDLPNVPWARPGLEFHFCEASTVVMRSEISAVNIPEFCEALRKVGLDSIYYHFFESRWRLEPQDAEDFSYWIGTNFDLPDLVEAIRSIDVYFYTLPEIRQTLVDLIHRYVGEACDHPG